MTTIFSALRSPNWEEKKYHHRYCELNYRADDEDLYLYSAFAHGEKKAPIYDIMVYADAGDRRVPKDQALQRVRNFAENEHWEIVNYAFSSEPADLNCGTKGRYLDLLVKKDFNILMPQD